MTKWKQKVNYNKYPDLNHWRITYHWSAGNYTQVFKYYHYCIQYINNKANLVKTLPISEQGMHTWMSNTKNIGICFCGMYDATERNLGKYPLKRKQLELGAYLGAELVYKLHIPLENVKDHYWYYSNSYPMSYGNEVRWDIKPYFDDVIKALLYYLDGLKTNKLKIKLSKRQKSPTSISGR